MGFCPRGILSSGILSSGIFPTWDFVGSFPTWDIILIPREAMALTGMDCIYRIYIKNHFFLDNVLLLPSAFSTGLLLK